VTAATISAEPGTYALILRCTRTRTIRIGRLGPLILKSGWYAYVGSAFGPGGLQARIAHHARRAVRPHWHVDYIRGHTALEAVWYACGARSEHEWAAAISTMSGATIALPGFGSSDCRCPTHLYWFEGRPKTAGLTGVALREWRGVSHPYVMRRNGGPICGQPNK
jgi:Uri superfamily endonuclease